MECDSSTPGKIGQSEIVKVYYIDCYEDQWKWESNHMTFFAASGVAGFTTRNMWYTKNTGVQTYGPRTVT